MFLKLTLVFSVSFMVVYEAKDPRCYKSCASTALVNRYWTDRSTPQCQVFNCPVCPIGQFFSIGACNKCCVDKPGEILESSCKASPTKSCKAIFAKYYYDRKSNTCKESTNAGHYHKQSNTCVPSNSVGCLDMDNPNGGFFTTQEECDETCSGFNPG